MVNYNFKGILNRLSLETVYKLYNTSDNESFDYLYRDKNINYKFLQVISALFLSIKAHSADFSNINNSFKEVEKHLQQFLFDDADFLKNEYNISIDSTQSFDDIVTDLYFTKNNKESFLQNINTLFNKNVLNESQAAFISEFSAKMANFNPSFKFDNFKALSSTAGDKEPKGCYKRNFDPV